MSTENLEIFLAKLYSDRELLQRFLENSEEEIQKLDLSPEEKNGLRNIDRVGLMMASSSYARKREHHKHRFKFGSLLSKLGALIKSK